MSAYDQVIRGGTVIDGTGMAGYRADVGMKDGRIARIGRIRERGKDEIDAEGHIVTPGFIDGHTHLDAQVHWDTQGSCSSWNGVTTAAASTVTRPVPAGSFSIITSEITRPAIRSEAGAGLEPAWPGPASARSRRNTSATIARTAAGSTSNSSA